MITDHITGKENKNKLAIQNQFAIIDSRVKEWFLTQTKGIYKMAIISKSHDKIMNSLKTIKVGSFVFVPYVQGFKGKVVNMKDGQYHVQIKNSKGRIEVRKLPRDIARHDNKYQ